MSDTPDKLISFVIPCRNGGSGIARLLGRLEELEVPAGWQKEIVVGYQESTDNTLEVLLERGVTIAHSRDFGPGPARDAAVRLARGSVLYFIDADVVPADGQFLVHLARFVEEHPDFGVVGGPILLDPRQASNPVAVGDHLACWFNWTADRRSGVTTLFQPGASLGIRRSAYEAVRGFDGSFRVMQDFEIQERIQTAGWSIYYCSELPVYHTARDTVGSSWRHSWFWGRVYREAYLARRQRSRWWFIDRPRWFWINWPRVFGRRLTLVAARFWPRDKLRLLYSSPFLLATILVWSLAVVASQGQPRPEVDNP